MLVLRIFPIAPSGINNRAIIPVPYITSLPDRLDSFPHKVEIAPESQLIWSVNVVVYRPEFLYDMGSSLALTRT